MKPNILKQEEIDEDGYKFVHYYQGKDLVKKQSYRPNGSLIEEIQYEWDKAISATLPIKWRVFDEFGHVKNTCVALEFDERGIHKIVAWYDAEGKESFRQQLK